MTFNDLEFTGSERRKRDTIRKLNETRTRQSIGNLKLTIVLRCNENTVDKRLAVPSKLDLTKSE